MPQAAPQQPAGNPFDQFDNDPAAPMPSFTPELGPKGNVASSAGEQKPQAPWERDAEVAGATALGVAGTVLAHKYPEVGDVLERLRGFLEDHPVAGRTLVGGGVGAAAATPTAIRHGRPSDILLGAAGGAGAGLVLPTAVGMIPRAMTRFSLDPAERAAGKAVLGDFGRADAAADRLRALASRLRAASRAPVPDEATVGEMLGPQGNALAHAAIANPNPESAAYAQQIAARQAAAPARASEHINQALAPTQYEDAERTFLKNLAENSKPLYQDAFSRFPAVNSPVFNQDVMGSPAGQEAVQSAAERWAELHPNQPIGPVSPGGMTQSPALEFHQLVREELDDKISRLRKGVENGTERKKDLNAVRSLRNKYVNDLNELTGGEQSPYRAAAAQYQSDAATLDALHDGRDNFLKNSEEWSPERIKEYLNDLDFSQRDAFRSGAAEALFRLVGRSRDTANPFTKIAGNPDIRSKINALFDNPKQADNFLKAMEREAELHTSGKELLKSAGKAPLEAIQPPPSVGATLAKAGAHSINPHLGALRAAIDAYSMHRLPAEGLSEMMRKTGPAGATQLEKLANAARLLQRNDVLRRNLATGATLLGGAAGGYGLANLDRNP